MIQSNFENFKIIYVISYKVHKANLYKKRKITKMTDNDKVAVKVKILLLGDSAVGKSSLLTQYCDQDFSQGHMPTIGIEYKQKVLNLNNKKTVKIQLWDTAGH